jgi:hypothetical protein
VATALCNLSEQLMGMNAIFALYIFQVLEGWFFNRLTLCHCCCRPFLHMPAV